jgi:hypothetical protein
LRQTLGARRLRVTADLELLHHGEVATGLGQVARGLLAVVGLGQVEARPSGQQHLM